MLSPDLVITMLVTARNTNREVKITSSVKGTKKGLIQRLSFEGYVVAVEIEGEVFVIDLNALSPALFCVIKALNATNMTIIPIISTYI